MKVGTLARTALYGAVHSLLIRSSRWSALRARGLNDRQATGHGTRSRRGRSQAGRSGKCPEPCTASGPMAANSAGASRPQRRRQPYDNRISCFRLTRTEPPRSRGNGGRGNLVESPEPEGANAPKVAGQIETPCPPDPILRRPRADREEKRVTYGNGLRREDQLDPPKSNQKRLSKYARHRASAWHRDLPDDQHLSVPPTPLPDEGCKA